LNGQAYRWTSETGFTVTGFCSLRSLLLSPDVFASQKSVFRTAVPECRLLHRATKSAEKKGAGPCGVMHSWMCEDLKFRVSTSGCPQYTLRPLPRIAFSREWHCKGRKNEIGSNLNRRERALEDQQLMPMRGKPGTSWAQTISGSAKILILQVIKSGAGRGGEPP
jgi:hypothetical protein